MEFRKKSYILNYDINLVYNKLIEKRFDIVYRNQKLEEFEFRKKEYDYIYFALKDRDKKIYVEIKLKEENKKTIVNIQMELKKRSVVKDIFTFLYQNIEVELDNYISKVTKELENEI